MLQRADVQVTHADPRRLFARIENAAWTALVGVLHAPHSGFSMAVHEEWWHETQLIIDQCKTADPLFILMDANAPPGEADGQIVLRKGFDTTQSTKFLREFLNTNNMCLPATSQCHDGERGTWIDVREEKLHCIDHVAIPS